MELCSVKVAGFRRFREPSTLNTMGKLVALLGPNEAGKSSLLDAIALLDHDDEPARGDIARGATAEDFLIEGRFFLSAEDLDAAGLSGPHWLRVVKRADGARRFGIDPAPPKRDLTARRKLLAALQAAQETSKFATKLESAGALEDVDEILAVLGRENEDLEPADRVKILEFLAAWTGLIDDNMPAAIRRLPALVDSFDENEGVSNPAAFARRVLKGRLPRILYFDEDARGLASSYDLSSVGSDVPAALQNLCRTAELDIAALLTANAQKDVPRISTLELHANERLRERFKVDWQQSGVSVWLRVEGGRLDVQVMNSGREFTSFAERSDGLRQFVALQTFTTGVEERAPILLIDEADQRLHYDAQADLVQMLARQQIAAKVIYTTHSAGCLPEDLGNGVHFARPLDVDEHRSRVVNKFWAENELGFAPLLYGMGASTLAFFPTRHAVMVEGPSDMLLLPTMFREALDLAVLGFQFVPGLSSAGDGGLLHAPSIGVAKGILYLLDTDAGGASLKNRLSKHADRADLFSLGNSDGSAQETEDFLNPDLLLEAVNGLMKRYYSKAQLLERTDLVDLHRMAGLEATFRARTRKPLSKVNLAYEILDLLAATPGRPALAPERRKAFRTIASNMVKRFAAKGRTTA